jgi:hypothetical protein
MGPIDYSLNIANPLQSVLQGFQIGRQMRQEREQQAQAQREQEIFRTLANPNADFKTVQAAIQAVPQKAAEVMKFWQGLDENRKNTWFDAGTKALQGVKTGTDGKVDASEAIATMRQYSEAAANSGDKQTAQTFGTIAKVIENNPNAASAVINFNLGVWDSKRLKDFKEATAAASPETTQLQKTYDWLKAIKGQTYADRYLAVETEKFVPVPDKGVYRGSDVARSVWDVAEEQTPAPSELPPSAKDVPPPRLGPNGLPTSLTPDQYRVTAEALGKAKTDKWIKDNNIKIVAPPRTATINGKTFYQIDGAWFDNPEGR